MNEPNQNDQARIERLRDLAEDAADEDTRAMYLMWAAKIARGSPDFERKAQLGDNSAT
jgi:hypothetical protein